ncbi:amidohydrolase family protein [bacterium]|nr:amidohydrolase family protein [bacterium]
MTAAHRLTNADIRTMGGRSIPPGFQATPFLPGQRPGVAKAVPFYTRGATGPAFRVGDAGRLSAGLSADLIVPDHDILSRDPEDIAQTQVLMTLFANQTVHLA